MKTYYEEVKAWLEGPDDGRVPSEAFVGLVKEHEELLDKLIKIRKICCELDSIDLKEPDKWWSCTRWSTGWIMDVAKYGEGYADHRAPQTITERTLTKGITIPPRGSVEIPI